MTDLRDKIAGVLNIEGAFCGTCDREPGQSLYCTACARVLNGYADAVLAVLDLDKVLAEAWERGFDAGQAWESDVSSRVIPSVSRQDNPYRKAEK